MSRAFRSHLMQQWAGSCSRPPIPVGPWLPSSRQQQQQQQQQDYQGVEDAEVDSDNSSGQGLSRHHQLYQQQHHHLPNITHSTTGSRSSSSRPRSEHSNPHWNIGHNNYQQPYCDIPTSHTTTATATATATATTWTRHGTMARNPAQTLSTITSLTPQLQSAVSIRRRSNSSSSNSSNTSNISNSSGYLDDKVHVTATQQQHDEHDDEDQWSLSPLAKSFQSLILTRHTGIGTSSTTATTTTSKSSNSNCSSSRNDNDDNDDDNDGNQDETGQMRKRTFSPRRQQRQVEYLSAALDRAVACAQMAPNHKRTEPFTMKRILGPSDATRRLGEIVYHVTRIKKNSIPQGEWKRNRWMEIPAFLIALVHNNQTNPNTTNSVLPASGSDENHGMAMDDSNDIPTTTLYTTSTDPYQPLPFHAPETERQLEDYAAACAAIQNVLLSLHAEDIGTKWATGDIIHTPAFRELVQANPTDRIAALIMVGGMGSSSMQHREWKNSSSTEDKAQSRSINPSRRRRRRRQLHGDVLVDLPSSL